MKEKTVTWFQINNWVPIIASIILVASSWFTLQTRLALIEQKVEFVAQSQTEMIELFKNVETRYGELALQVERLETLQGIE